MNLTLGKTYFYLKDNLIGKSKIINLGYVPYFGSSRTEITFENGTKVALNNDEDNVFETIDKEKLDKITKDILDNVTDNFMQSLECCV